MDLAAAAALEKKAQMSDRPSSNPSSPAHQEILHKQATAGPRASVSPSVTWRLECLPLGRPWGVNGRQPVKCSAQPLLAARNTSCFPSPSLPRDSSRKGRVGSTAEKEENPLSGFSGRYTLDGALGSRPSSDAFWLQDLSVLICKMGVMLAATSPGAARRTRAAARQLRGTWQVLSGSCRYHRRRGRLSRKHGPWLGRVLGLPPGSSSIFPQFQMGPADLRT